MLSSLNGLIHAVRLGALTSPMLGHRTQIYHESSQSRGERLKKEKQHQRKQMRRATQRRQRKK